jgi:hypothetical protein
MKMIAMTVLASVACSILACVGGPTADLKPKGPLSCSAPGTRCDYGDQCCSGMCDANDCRGPVPKQNQM